MTIAAVKKKLEEEFPTPSRDGLLAPSALSEEDIERLDITPIFGLYQREEQTPAQSAEKPKHRPGIQRSPMHASGIHPEWDVAQIATPGHMLTARVQNYTHRMYGPMISLGLTAISIFIGGQFMLPVLVRTPQWLEATFTYDPNTYFDIGGGMRGGPNLKFLSDNAPKPEGLSVDDFTALVKATETDLAAHGYEAKSWTNVAGLKTAPKITRPDKVFTQYPDRLKDGIVAIPDIPSFATIIAHVGGQWAITLARPNQCRTVAGPVIEGCEDAVGNSTEQLSDDALRALSPMAPAKHQE